MSNFIRNLVLRGAGVAPSVQSEPPRRYEFQTPLGITGPPREETASADDLARRTAEESAAAFHPSEDESSVPRTSVAQTLEERPGSEESETQSSGVQEETELPPIRRLKLYPSSPLAETESVPSDLTDSSTVMASRLPGSGSPSPSAMDSSQTTRLTDARLPQVDRSLHVSVGLSDGEVTSETSSGDPEPPQLATEKRAPLKSHRISYEKSVEQSRGRRIHPTPSDWEHASMASPPVLSPLPPEPPGPEDSSRKNLPPPFVELVPVMPPSTFLMEAYPPSYAKESRPVKVRIGTIEVKATTPPKPAPPSAPKPQGFDDYFLIRNYLTRGDY